MQLTIEEVYHLLECINRAHGITVGYSDDEAVGRLQAKLSVQLQYLSLKTPLERERNGCWKFPDEAAS